MLRVVIISTLPPQKTGEAPYTAALIQGLVSRGNIDIIAISGPEANELPSELGNVKTLRIWKGRSILYPFRLFRRISKMRANIVHVQFGPHGEVYGGMFGEPMLLLLLLLRSIGIKTTITLHSTWMTNQVEKRISSYRLLGRFSFIAAPVFRLYMKMLQWGTSKIQLSTSRIDSELRKRFLHEYRYDMSKVDEIPHPCRKILTQIEKKYAKETLGLKDRQVALLFGFIRRGKGFEVALRAFEKVKQDSPKAVLLIAGKPQDRDGEGYLKELRILASSLNLSESVRFDAKFIPSDTIPLYFGAADITLVPYTESVGASGPIHNYAGYGVPVIASNVGYHMKESLGGGLTLFRNGDANDLAKKIVNLLANDDLRRVVSEKQLNYAEQETWELAANRTMVHYKSLLRQKK